MGRKLVRLLLVVFLLLPLALTLAYRFLPPPATPLMVIRLFEGEGLSKDWVPLAEMSAKVAPSVIAAEDNLFCRHWGFDWQAVQAALAEAEDGERLRGASTISMQTAKNVFLWPGRSFVRKGLEAYLTPFLELFWDKRRIVEVYLNIAEWGPGIYGIEAAARHHFSKPARDLSAREAALLAAVLPNPREWSPSRPSAYIAERSRVIQRRVGQLGPLLDCIDE